MSIVSSSGQEPSSSSNKNRAGIVTTLLAALVPSACTSVGAEEIEAQRQRELVEALYSKFDQQVSDNLNSRLAMAVAQALNKLTKEDLHDLIKDAVKDVVPNHVDLERDKLVKAIASEMMSRIAEDNKLTTALSDWHSDPAVLRRNMLQPSVQISLGSNVGSGVILQKCQESTVASHKYYILTCWHTFREKFTELLKDPSPGVIDLSKECMTGPEVHVKVYASGRPALESARLVYADAARDLAVLQMESEYDLPTAKFDMNRRGSNLSVLSPVMIVGCPLGNDPIPTTGIISDMNHQVEESSFLMTTAPAHIGNSGGAIFSLETGELEGIFVKVYMAGATRPQVVSHMGLGVPRQVIHDFLKASGLPEFDLSK
jgi:S1-C subfamily serine protease